MKNLTLNKKLALVAMVLGVIALFAGNPYKGNHFSVDSKDIEYTISKGIDKISPDELADQIIKGTLVSRIFDVRSENEFKVYSIPGAESIPAASIEKANILRNEKLILVCKDGISSAQIWTLLKAKGYKSVYILSGGIDEWSKKILFPALAENPTPEQINQYDKIKEVSKYFGGTPQTGSNTELKETPKIQAPKLQTPSGTGTTVEPKKKKEGC